MGATGLFAQRCGRVFRATRLHRRRWRFDDAQAFELDLYNVIVANGRYVAWWDPGRAGSRRRGWIARYRPHSRAGAGRARNFGGPDPPR